MGKVLTIGGMVVAAAFALVSILDMAAGIPFSTASMALDIGFLVSSLILGYLSWDAFRDAR